MKTAKRDTSFVRFGKPLVAWLPEVVSVEPSIRRAAGDAIAAMYYGVSSVHDDLGVDVSLGQGKEHEDAWREAVQEALVASSFPASQFLSDAVDRLLNAQKEYRRELAAVPEDEQYQRILRRLEARIAATEDDQLREQLTKRLNRAMCASLERSTKSNKDSPEPEIYTFSYQVLPWILTAAGPRMLDVPESIHRLLGSVNDQYLAYGILEELGPDAEPLFLEYLTRRFKNRRVGGDWFDASDALAAVGRGNAEVVELLLEAVESWRIQAAWSGSATLLRMGEAARVHEQALPRVLDLTYSGDPQRRALAAMALGGLAKGTDVAIDRLLQLTYDESTDEEGYGGQIVAGCAITALGSIARQPERVIPRFMEIFDAFEEFDCDMGYGGEHAHLCDALKEFGASAVLGLPVLLNSLQEGLKKGVDEWYGQDILEVLSLLGTGAVDVIPILEKLDEAWLVYCREDHEMCLLDDEDEDIEEEESDEDFEPEESDFRKTINAILGTPRQID